MATEEGQEQGPGPGEQLRRAREAMGRSLEDISEELRLSVDQVRSLEAEAFHRLPGEAYVRGYLRNYAAAVGIPPEEVMVAYDQECEGSGESSREEESPLVPAPERPLIEHPWRVVWVSLALLVVVTVVTLWLVGESRRPALTEQPASADSQSSAPTASPAAEEPLPKDQEEEPSPEIAADQEGGPNGGSQESAEAGASAEEGGTENGGANGAGEEEAETGSQEGEAESQTAAAPRPEGPVLTGPDLEGPSLPDLSGRSGEEEPAQSGDLETLRVHTWADSWLEVADDRGRTLLRRLVKEGRDVRLYGEAPFQVRVGNAAGVQLYFEGAPLPPLGGPGEVVGLRVDADSRTIPESEVAAPENPEPVSEAARPGSETPSPAGEGDGENGPAQETAPDGGNGAGNP